MQRARRIGRSSVFTMSALAGAVSAVCVPQLMAGATYTENFTIKPLDWDGVNNAAPQSTASFYGYSNTNNTGQTAAGEAGGVFARSNERGYYADTRLYGSLTQANYIHGEGEFSFGNGATADTDFALGHQNTATATGGNFNILGIGVFEGTTAATGFRFTYQIYNDAGSDFHGNRTDFANGQYYYKYDWDPISTSITVNLYTAADHVNPIYTENSGALPITFSTNAFGFVSGMNGSTDASKNYTIYTDAVKYSTFMPKVNQPFNSSPANWQKLAQPPQNYGFSNTNNTGQESGAGEAGGTFTRDFIRSAYADTKMQFLTQAQPFGASGELSLNNANSPDNEVFICHMAKEFVDGVKEGDNTAVGQGGRSMAGLYILDSTPTSYRVRARVYTAGTATTVSTRIDGATDINVPQGQYKFDYVWDPTALTLTARVLNTDGSVFGTSVAQLAAGDQLNMDSFGLTTGFNGSLVPTSNYQVFMDNVTYTVGQQWQTDASSTWTDQQNWDGPVPNGVDHVAYFGSKITAARTVTVDSAKTVGHMFFDSAQSYTVAGANTITVDGGAVGSKITSLQGNHTVSAPVSLATDTTVNVAAGSLTISALQPSSSNITKTGAGVMNVNGVKAASLTISAGKVKAISAGNTNTNLSRVANLTIANGALFDINDTKLIVTNGSVGTWNGSNYENLTGQVASGRNGNALPRWDGTTGIITSQTAATTSNFHSIGIAKGSEVKSNSVSETALWAGQTITGTDVLVMYTYGGDANLDGKINVDDYIKIDNGISAGLTGWSNGDFNYDGKINIDDYSTVIDFNIGIQNGFVFATGSGVDGLTAVPEPAAATISMIGLAAASMWRRRRRA